MNGRNTISVISENIIAIKGATMNQHDITEQAYKNGYAKGYEDGKNAARETMLEPCPNCEYNRPWIVRVHPLRWIFTKYYIECGRCHYCGKTKMGKRRAIRAWNKEVIYAD